MKTARELYHFDEDSWKMFYDYQPIIDSFGNILIQVDDRDYQGDSRILYEKDGKYGFLVFGWGSCSGCDSLQACDKFEDVDNLICDLYRNIKWFDSFEECREYILDSYSREGEFYWHVDEWKIFVEQVKEYVSV